MLWERFSQDDLIELVGHTRYYRDPETRKEKDAHVAIERFKQEQGETATFVSPDGEAIEINLADFGIE